MKIDILAFGAHPDDVELSAGGSLLREQNAGFKTAIIDLTRGELGTRGSAEIRAAEAEKAAEILNLTNRENLSLPDGFFDINQESLLKVVTAIRKYKPNVVLANAPVDRHPDHGRASQLVTNACFLSGLPKVNTCDLNGMPQNPWRVNQLHYYIQFNTLEPDFYVDISEFISLKMKAIEAYSSQFYNPNSKEPITPIATQAFFESLKGRAADWGKIIATQYAEAFVSARKPAIKSFSDIF
jgi:bacillithiol biosynthesis deacetylase BshB1